MKKYYSILLVVILVIGFMAAGAVGAAAGIINDFSSTKELINNLSPKVGEFYNMHTHELETIYSISVYDWNSNDLHIASIELGYYNDQGILGIINFDLKQLNKMSFDIPLGRFEPTIGFAIGHNFKTNDWGMGPVLTGLKLRF